MKVGRNFRRNGYIYGLDGGDDFTGLYLSSNSSNFIYIKYV